MDWPSSVMSHTYMYMQAVKSKKKNRSSTFVEGFEFSVAGAEEFAWDMEEAIDMAAKNQQVSTAC